LLQYWKPIASGGKFQGNFGKNVHHTAELIYISDGCLAEHLNLLGQRQCSSILPGKPLTPEDEQVLLKAMCYLYALAAQYVEITDAGGKGVGLRALQS